MTTTFDSWAWAEYFAAGKRGESVKAVVDSSEEICTASISLLELKVKYSREGRPFQDRLDLIRRRSRIIPLDEEIALAAADHKASGLHTSDAIIYATAQSVGSILFTGDEHFRKLSGVKML